MTPQVKLRLLASGDTTLQGYLGAPPAGFRWFDFQLPQGQLAFGTCVRVKIISANQLYGHNGRQPLTGPRFQIDVLDPSAERAREVAAAIIAFLGTIDLASNAQFTSPVTTPRQFPVFILNQRPGMEVQTEPPVFVESLDIRAYNKE